MAASYSIFIVDWNLFKQQVLDTSEIQGFLQGLEVEKESNELYTLSMDIIDILDQLLGTYFTHKTPKGFLEKMIQKCDTHLAKSSEAYPEIIKLDQVMSALNWGYRDEAFRILDHGSAIEMMELAWSPETVKKYSSILASVHWAKIQPRFEKHGIKSRYGGIRSFESLAEFCRSWESVLKKAVIHEKGLLVYVDG